MSFVKKYKNYVVTFGIEFLILLLGFFIFRIANEKLNGVGFSEFTLSRRNISFLQPLLMMGLGVAVPRYMSIHQKKDSYLPTALCIMGGVGLFFIVALFLARGFMAHLFFGDSNYQFLILPLVVLLVSYGFHSILYGYLRGKGQIYLANVFQLLNIGISPVVVLLCAQDVEQYMYLNALFVFVSVLFFSVFIFRQNRIEFNRSIFKEDSAVLLSYGLPRVFGDFALLALLTIPAYIVLSVQHDLLAGGDIAYAITLFNLVGAAFGPLSLVLLPEISKFLVESKFSLIKQRFYFFVLASLALTAFGYLVFIGFHHTILSMLLGANYRPEIFEISKVVLLGSFGYVIYIVLRSFLDAIHVKAKNSKNLLIALASYLLLLAYCHLNSSSAVSYLYAFVIAVNLLGLLTFIQTYYSIKKLK